MPQPTAEEIWRRKTDEEVAIAATRLHDFTPEGQSIIQAELNRRKQPEYRASKAADARELQRATRRAQATPQARTARRLRLLFSLLALPLCGVATSVGLSRGVDTASLCTSDTASDFCDVAARLLTPLGISSLLVAGAGLALFAGIAAYGRAARRDRKRLLAVFERGFKVVAAALVALIAAHAAIAIVAVSLIEYLVFGRVNPWLPMAFLVGAVVGVVSLKDAAFGPAATPRAAGPGQVVAAREEPALWALIRDVAARVGTDPPDQIIVGLAPQFFVTEVEVVTPAGPLRGRTLYCSLALLRILSVDELRAVVGHELAHFHGADTTFSSRIYPTYHATEAAIRTLIVQGGRGIRQAITRPAILALASFAEAMGEAERAFSRDRELAADAVGAAVTSAAAMASALAKVDAYNDVWLEVRKLVAASNASGSPVSNIAATFADVVRRRAAEAALALPLESHVTHPTDTHPPTAMRLSALGIAVERACADARAVTPDPPAASLITTAVSRELALSATALSRPQKT